MGIVAGDADCYEVFRDLFDAVLRKSNPGVSLDGPPPSDLDAQKVTSDFSDQSGAHLVSAQIRVQRNIQGLRMPPATDRLERRAVERVLAKALLDLPNNFRGQYDPIEGSSSYANDGMDIPTRERLENADLLIKEPDLPMMLSSGSGRCWPEARGVFSTPSTDLAAWINEEDHLKLI